jgi:hypothetical protein
MHAVLHSHDHQAQPGPKPAESVSDSGSKHPRKIRSLKLDSREVIGLETDTQVNGLHSHDLPLVDAGNVSGSDKPQFYSSLVQFVDA